MQLHHAIIKIISNHKVPVHRPQSTQELQSLIYVKKARQYHAQDAPKLVLYLVLPLKV